MGFAPLPLLLPSYLAAAKINFLSFPRATKALYEAVLGVERGKEESCGGAAGFLLLEFCAESKKFGSAAGALAGARLHPGLERRDLGGGTRCPKLLPVLVVTSER